MILIKLFMAAFLFVVLLDELVKQDWYGNDKMSIIKIGMLMIFEMWLLGGYK